MRKIKFEYMESEFISLAKNAGVNNNTPTTKHISAQPSRHTLAIFTPNAPKRGQGVFITSLQDTHKHKVSSVYGGLIGVNTTPKGNSPSRICAVVETCHPFFGVVLLTKHIGVFA